MILHKVATLKFNVLSGLDGLDGVACRVAGNAFKPLSRIVSIIKQSSMFLSPTLQVKYSIVQQPNQKGTKFTVDEETGEVSTNKVFDREGDDGKFVSVTVKATDQGDPSLEGVCSFTVEITDVNDNPPLFDRQVSWKN